MAISLGQLDLEALKNYLKIVQGFRTVNDPSRDTEYVDGIEASLIAIAALIDGQLLKDELGNDRRDVVNHALNLLRINEEGDQTVIKADEIITKTESKELQNIAVQASRNTANDMRSLRNEMYRLKRDMIRTGAMAYDPVYDGFIDPFINNLNVFTSDELIINDTLYDSRFEREGISVSGLVDAYRAGQSVAIISKGKALAVDEINEMTGNGMIIGDDSFLLSSGADTVSKSYGIYDNGKFVFGSNNEDSIDLGDSINMIYKDGPNRIKVLELDETKGVAGFASTIVVPAELDGNYLNAVSLSLRTVGNPGVIYCELYDYKEDMLYKDPIATSNYLNSAATTGDWRTYQFTFNSDIMMENGHVYLLLVKAAGTYVGNTWFLGGFEEPCNYSVHQDTYLYGANGSFSKEGADVITNKVSDIFIGLYTTGTRRVSLAYSKVGLYTGSFALEHNTATRVRVSFNPGLNGKVRESFDVNDYYTVTVIGRNDKGQYLDGVLDINGAKQFKHTVWANGEESADEYAYDFDFEEPVVFIEFQIIYKNANNVNKDSHGELFAVVASTDNAYLRKED